MHHLILPNRHEISLVKQDVRCHHQRVAEESIGAQILRGQVLLLLFIGRDALQPAERSDHRKQLWQLEMRLYVALHEDGAYLRIEARSQKVQRHIQRVLLYL
jgi:hypothetical protein